jgi:hypothetical protein
MKNLLLQSRAVTDPIKNPLVGWWLEYYFFYVPLRALSGSADYQAMMLNPAATAGNTAAASVPYYRYTNSVNYVEQCLQAVVEEFFRDEGETWNTQTVNSVVAAQLVNSTWLDSVANEDTFEANEPADIVVEGADADTNVEASEIEIAMRQWNMLRGARLTDQTFEDFIRTYGVRIPDKEVEILPELIRYVRQWQYPSNTVNSSTGVPVSAVSWAVAERADKDRFFREPGFIFGVTCCRPKVYLSKQSGSAAGLLDSVYGWMPAVLGNDPYASLKEVAAGAGPLNLNTDGYYVDLKDLYLYGDQFVNFALSDTNGNLVAVPTAALVKKYASTSDVQGLFSGTVYDLKQDGIVQLSILSRVVDTTAKT